MRQSIAAVVLAPLLFASPTSAADLAPMPRKALPEITVASWTGFYIGGNAGYSWGVIRTSENSLTTSGPLVGIGAGTFNPALTFPGDDRRFNNNGAIGGVQAGYNLQYANIVVGIEADWQAAAIRGRDAFPATAAGPFYTSNVEVAWFGTVRPRIGYSMGQWMPYVTGGLAYGHIKSSLNVQPGPESAPRGPAFLTNISSTVVGYAAGVGVEVMLGRFWSMKAEYLHIDLGNNPSIFDYAAAGSVRARATNPLEIARVGVNYRF